MCFVFMALSFPAWAPHFAFPENLIANEMMVLRWLHIISGIIWIGLLYFFNLVGGPAMQQLDAPMRAKVYPALMSRAMWWFRWSATLTVVVGVRYFFHLLSVDARNAGDTSWIMRWFWRWLLVWTVAYFLIYALQLPAKGLLDNVIVRVLGVALVVVAVSWMVIALNGGPTSSNEHLAISVGGGLGYVMLMNTWGVVWRVQKRVDSVGAGRGRTRHAHASAGRPVHALGFSHRSHVVLALVPHAVLHGSGEPLPIPEHGRALSSSALDAEQGPRRDAGGVLDLPVANHRLELRRGHALHNQVLLFASPGFVHPGSIP